VIVVHANATDGLTVTQDGQPLRLAVVDEHGHVLVAGDPVARAVESAAEGAYLNYLKARGHERVDVRVGEAA
jgi:hypothetical protein